MSFFQTELDTMYLREEHRGLLPMLSPETQVKAVQGHAPITTKLIFHRLFKSSVVNETKQNITSDPMNRLVSFHL